MTIKQNGLRGGNIGEHRQASGVFTIHEKAGTLSAIFQAKDRKSLINLTIHPSGAPVNMEQVLHCNTRNGLSILEQKIKQEDIRGKKPNRNN